MSREYLRLGEILLNKGLLTSEQVAQALASQRRNRMRLGEIVVAAGWVSEEDLAQALADQYDYEYVDASTIEPERDSLHVVSGRFALAMLILPYREFNRRLYIATADPLDLESTDKIRSLQDLPLKISIAGPVALRAAIIRHYTLECDPEETAPRQVQASRPARIDWQADRDALLIALDDIRGSFRAAA